jgi:hypothetical protein
MTLLGKLDRLVYATGIDRILFMRMQPRTLRWTPLLVITALVAGYVMMTKTPSVMVRDFWIGLLLFWGAFLAAHFVRAFGPRLMATELHPLDERELMVKARAYAISGLVLAMLAMAGCFYMSGAGALGLWHPRIPYDWINLGFGIQAGAMLMPTWVASWLEPRPAADHED